MVTRSLNCQKKSEIRFTYALDLSLSEGQTSPIQSAPYRLQTKPSPNDGSLHNQHLQSNKSQAIH